MIFAVTLARRVLPAGPASSMLRKFHPARGMYRMTIVTVLIRTVEPAYCTIYRTEPVLCRTITHHCEGCERHREMILQERLLRGTRRLCDREQMGYKQSSTPSAPESTTQVGAAEHERQDQSRFPRARPRFPGQTSRMTRNHCRRDSVIRMDRFRFVVR